MVILVGRIRVPVPTGHRVRSAYAFWARVPPSRVPRGVVVVVVIIVVFVSSRTWGISTGHFLNGVVAGVSTATTTVGETGLGVVVIVATVVAIASGVVMAVVVVSHVGREVSGGYVDKRERKRERERWEGEVIFKKKVARKGGGGVS